LRDPIHAAGFSGYRRVARLVSPNLIDILGSR
jgi:hypothetical protein